MAFLKNILCGIAAVFLAEVIPTSYSLAKGSSSEKATGLAVIAVGFVESLLSPTFWILAIPFFILFRWASRLQTRPLRVILFWVPSVVLSILAIMTLGMFTYLFVHFGHS